MVREANRLSLCGAARAIADGTLTSEALTAACLDRIRERDPSLRAWAFLDPARALDEARQLDRSPRRGLLHGVPVGIKDVIDTAAYPTECNSPIYACRRPKADAACVAMLKAAGALVLGKTVTTEFANIHPAETRNPHNPAHTPGGSSSGSAVAVADLMVPLALGTQTAGSIIRPAAFCGVFAIKPTFGSVNRAGLKFVAESLDTIGLFARSAEDLALGLRVLSGRATVERDGAKPRVGICRTTHWEQASEDVHRQLEAAAQALTKAGADVRNFELPTGSDQLIDRHKAIMGFESARALAWEYATYPALISPALKARLDDGWNVARAEYDEVMALARTCSAALAEEMSSIDFLMTPAAPGEAPASIETTGDSMFNRAWTLLGNPCVTVPFGTGANGLPLGVQLVGAREADMRLLAWVDWVSAALRDRM